MKLLFSIVFLSMMLTACSQKNEKVSSGSNEGDPSEISISNLISVDDLNVNNGTLTVDSQINFSLNQKQLVTKLLRIKNNTVADKSLAVSISGDGFILGVNRCPSVLPAGKVCDVRVIFDPGKKFNNTYSGSLNVTASGIIPLSVVYNVSGNDAPLADGSVNDLEVSMPQSFSGYVPGSLIPTRKIVVKNPTLKEISNISFDIDSKYGILLNRCGVSLKPQESCSIIVFYKDIKVSPPQIGSEFRVSQNAQIKSLSLIGEVAPPAPEVYLATYSAYSPSNPVLSACDGVVISSRSIVSCKKQSDNQVVANSFCSDLIPTISYSSPEGAIVSSITNGSKSDSCHAGSSVVYDSVITCNSDAYLSGSNCLLKTAITTTNSFGLNYTEYKSAFSGFTSADSSGGTVLSAPDIKSISSAVAAGSSTASLDVSIANVAASSAIASQISQKQSDTVAYARANSVLLTSQACDSSIVAGLLCSIDSQLAVIDVQVSKSNLIANGASSIRLNFNNGQNYIDMPVHGFFIEQAADTGAGNGASAVSALDDNPRIKFTFTPFANNATQNILLFAANNENGVQKLFALGANGSSVDLVSNTSGSALTTDNIGVVFGKNNTFYFAANNSQGRLKLFRTVIDSTFNATMSQVTDLNAAGSDLIGSEAVEFNNAFYFGCGATVMKLCKLDLVDGSLKTVSNTSGNAATNDSPQTLFVFNDKLYFSALAGATPVQKLHELNAAGQVSLLGIRASNLADGFQVPVLFNGEMYFAAYKGSGAVGMVKLYSMNTSGAIVQRSNMNASINDVAATSGTVVAQLRVLNNELYFAGAKAVGISKLFKINTSGVISQLSDIGGSDAVSDAVGSLLTYSNEIYFSAGSPNVKLYRLGSGGYIRQLTDIVSGGTDFTYGSVRGFNSSVYLAMKNSAGKVKLMKMTKSANYAH